MTELNYTYNYYIKFADGKAEYREGIHESPSITIYAPVSVWYDICSGRLNGVWGLLTGKYRIKGSFYYLGILKRLLARKFTNEEIPGIEDFLCKWTSGKRTIWPDY